MPSHVFKVEMTCEGCANAVTKVLSKHKDKGITNFVVSLNETKVEVESDALTKDQILEILQKTGKTVSYVEEKK